MQVFISWSGSRARRIGSILNEWLPMLVQRIQPFYSPDMEKGTRWSAELSARLEAVSVGIICVTPENKDAPWIMFEAGALAKSQEGRVWAVLFGLEQSDIQRNPLSQMQLTAFSDDQDVHRLAESINDALGDEAIDPSLLGRMFRATWPEVKEKIQAVLNEPVVGEAVPAGSKDEIVAGALDEILANVRATSRTLERMSSTSVAEGIRGQGPLATATLDEAARMLGSSRSADNYSEDHWSRLLFKGPNRSYMISINETTYGGYITDVKKKRRVFRLHDFEAGSRRRALDILRDWILTHDTVPNDPAASDTANEANEASEPD